MLTSARPARTEDSPHDEALEVDTGNAWGRLGPGDLQPSE